MYDIKNNILKPLADSTLGKQSFWQVFHLIIEKLHMLEIITYITDFLSDSLEIPITKNGEINKLINGATDWVYEEEFSIHNGFFWSPEWF